MRDKKRMLDGFAGFTGRPIETLREDFKRDFYLDAKEAVEYGLVDNLLLPKNRETDPTLDPNLTEAKFGAFSSGEEQQYGGETWGLKQNEEKKGASFDAPLDGGGGGGDGPATM